MLKNSLIIIPFQLPWNWSADYQWQTCLELAKNNLVIAYIQPDARFWLKPKPKQQFPHRRNILFYQPRYLIPVRRLAGIEKLNQLLNIWYLLLRDGLTKKQAILWLFDPGFWFYPKVKWAFPKLIALYDCVDYVWHRQPKLRKLLQTQEKKLIKQVDFFFVNSAVLAKHHSTTRRPTAVVPQGFRLTDFAKPKTTKAKFPKDKPLIGYVGAIDHRLDFALLYRLIKRNPQWQFVLWGPVQEMSLENKLETTRQLHTLKKLPNVIVGQSTDRREIPNIIKQFDVCLIPYDTKQLLVKYSYPMKLFEYFYCKKPVITAPILELKRFSNLVKIEPSLKSWQTTITSLLTRRQSSQVGQWQRKLSLANGWKNKIINISKVIQNSEQKGARKW
ncbi:MAG: Glycosyl transferase group 1 [Candidatus Pacebacteria bacterium GW2011_GWA1_46_10]|nr:MAG: Glycosyl transferase group 1 [Candidatus Pacebacteria bacterium GW2011_GWA1_46_10]